MKPPMRITAVAAALFLLVHPPQILPVMAAADKKSLLRGNGGTSVATQTQITRQTRKRRNLKGIGNSFAPTSKTNKSSKDDSSENQYQSILAASLPPIHPMVGNGWVPIPPPPGLVETPSSNPPSAAPTPAAAAAEPSFNHPAQSSPGVAFTMTNTASLPTAKPTTTTTASPFPTRDLSNTTNWIFSPDTDITIPEDIEIETDFPDYDDEVNEDEESPSQTTTNVAPADVVTLLDEGDVPQIIRPIHVEPPEPILQVQIIVTDAPNNNNNNNNNKTNTNTKNKEQNNVHTKSPA